MIFHFSIVQVHFVYCSFNFILLLTYFFYVFFISVKMGWSYAPKHCCHSALGTVEGGVVVIIFQISSYFIYSNVCAPINSVKL